MHANIIIPSVRKLDLILLNKTTKWKSKTITNMCKYYLLTFCHYQKILPRLLTLKLKSAFLFHFCFGVLGANDGTAHIWNLNNGTLLRKLNPKADVMKNAARQPVLYKRPDDVVGVIWSEDNSRISE